MNPDQIITGVSKSGRSFVYLSAFALAILALAGVVSGTIPIVLYLGLIFSLAFVALFLTNLRLFIIVFMALRTLMEAFLEPTRIPLGGSTIQLVGFMGIVILFGGMIYLIINRVKIYEMSVVMPMLGFLAATLLPMLLMSSDIVTGLKDWVGTASALMIFVLVVYLFQDRKDVWLLLGAFMASAIIPLAVGYYQLFTDTGNHFSTPGLNRIMGTFIHPNSLGAYLAMMLLMCIPLMLESKETWHRIGLGMLNLVMIFGLIFTYARASWFGLMIGLFIIFAVRYRKLLLIFPPLLAIVIFMVPSITERLQEIINFSQSRSTPGSILFRYEMTRYLLPKFYASPIIGNGLGSFGAYIEEGLGFSYLPHNDYMRVLVDTGLIGMACYLMFWYGLARGAVRSYLRQSDLMKVMSLVLLAVVCNYLFASLTENLFRMAILQTYIWTLAGIVAAGARSILVSADSRSGRESDTEDKASFNQLNLSDAQA